MFSGVNNSDLIYFQGALQFSDSQEHVTPAEYSRGTDPNVENEMKGSNKNKWSIFNCFSQHKNVSHIVFIVILNAFILAYLIAAVVYFTYQGKFKII